MNELITIRPISSRDRSDLERLFADAWGVPRVVGLGHVYELPSMPGLLAVDGARILGALTHSIVDGACEFVSVNAFVSGRGVGSQLLEGGLEFARQAGCRHVWLITTNDNAQALTVYQRFGFRLAKLHVDAVAADRKIKPEIPLVAENGVPIRDYLELEIILED